MAMLHLTYDDINMAYKELQTIQKHFTVVEDTRNGMARVFTEPVCVEYTIPYRRVLFDPVRDANPFFHYMEVIWMLAGSNTTRFISRFSKQISQYSDDGIKFHGAYGHRWRFHFDTDQLEEVILLLKKQPKSRQAVLAMWDPTHDLNEKSKDLPCNTHIYFRNMSDALTMTVCNRSNDLVWGMMGANAVHMSCLHEYIANAVDLAIGSYYQFTNNLHIYEGWEDKWSMDVDNWYLQNPTFKRWAFSPENINLYECETFVMDEEQGGPYKCRILRDNAMPMLRSWDAYKTDKLDLALHYASNIYDEDWRRACVAWMIRRKEARDERKR